MAVILRIGPNSYCFKTRPPSPFTPTPPVTRQNAPTPAQALMIHKDHVSAVMDVSFSPTGQEFASGSYDRTVRVFPHRAGRSREVYHTKRMQRVFCVNFSADARYGQPSFGAHTRCRWAQ